MTRASSGLATGNAKQLIQATFSCSHCAGATNPKHFASNHKIRTAKDRRRNLLAIEPLHDSISRQVCDAISDRAVRDDCPVTCFGHCALVVPARVLLGHRLHACRFNPFRSPRKGRCGWKGPRSYTGQFLAASFAGWTYPCLLCGGRTRLPAGTLLVSTAGVLNHDTSRTTEASDRRRKALQTHHSACKRASAHRSSGRQGRAFPSRLVARSTPQPRVASLLPVLQSRKCG
jgi:hypothetical protein